MNSLEKPDRGLDELWAKEAEDRIDAYEKGELRDLSI
ncbi:MAG: addiction module protein [Desulfobacterales bacterium]|nr:addiction module protein [Desulfobacterales bacterium]